MGGFLPGGPKGDLARDTSAHRSGWSQPQFTLCLLAVAPLLSPRTPDSSAQRPHPHPAGQTLPCHWVASQSPATPLLQLQFLHLQVGSNEIPQPRAGHPGGEGEGNARSWVEPGQGGMGPALAPAATLWAQASPGPWACPSVSRVMALLGKVAEGGPSPAALPRCPSGPALGQGTRPTPHGWGKTSSWAAPTGTEANRAPRIPGPAQLCGSHSINSRPQKGLQGTRLLLGDPRCPGSSLGDLGLKRGLRPQRKATQGQDGLLRVPSHL